MKFDISPDCTRALHTATPLITIGTALLMVGFFATDARMQTHINPLRQEVAVLEQKVDQNARIAVTAVTEVQKDIADVQQDINELKADIRWLIQQEINKK